MFSAQIDNGPLMSLPATNSLCPHTAQLDLSETQPAWRSPLQNRGPLFTHRRRWKAVWAAPVALLVKNLPAMQEAWVQSLGWEDPLEKGTATHSSILAWRIPWTV